jgi:type VI secretion system protein ImpH
MAATGRRSYASIIEALRAAPERFEFIQAVRLLERASVGLRRAGRDAREAVPGLIGFDSDPRSETIRLRAALELAFPATEIAAFDDTAKKPELTVTMLGLIGVSGVLPGHYSRLVLETSRGNNTAPQDFIDIFNHRALSLFVRAAEKYRLPLAFERARAGELDTVSAALLGLIGMRGSALQNRQGIRDETLMFYAGHFARRVRTADALRQMLSEHFDWPVVVTQFQGHWADLLPGEQTQIGRGGAGAAYASLGASAILGTRVWDVQGSFRVKLGPLDYAQFHSFMPDARRMAELAALTRTYVGPALSFDVQLTLKGAEVPPLVLSADQRSGARLGWNTWLPTQAARSDASDAIFQVEAV